MKKFYLGLFGIVLFSLNAFGQNFSEILKIVAFDREAGGYFGVSVSISGDYAIVGADGEGKDATGNNLITDAGAAYIFERDNAGNWSQVQKIVASDRTVSAFFGHSVSISGDYAIVGAYQSMDNSGSINSGAAYIFERNTSGNWIEVQKIAPSDAAVNNRFGFSVSISGNYAIVGAYANDFDASGANSISNAGAAYIFERDNSGNWSQVQKIVASDRATNDLFGGQVSISNNVAIIGASGEDEDENGANTLESAGSAYIFERDNSGNWNQVQKIVASDRAANDLFGKGISISGDYAIIGARQHDVAVQGQVSANTNAGAAYIFKRSNTGHWDEVQQLIASDNSEGAIFGLSVGISGDYAVVASLDKYDENGGNAINLAGSAYIFEKDNSGSWNQIQKIVASDRSFNDQFGVSVSISGNQVLVGAYFDAQDANGVFPLTSAGSAYFFEGSGLLGVDDNILSKVFVKHYPNPTSQYVTFDLTGLKNRAQSIKIVDVTGKVIYQTKNIPSYSIQIGTEKWSPGVYIVQIITAEQHVSFKLVKE